MTAACRLPAQAASRVDSIGAMLAREPNPLKRSKQGAESRWGPLVTVALAFFLAEMRRAIGGGPGGTPRINGEHDRTA